MKTAVRTILFAVGLGIFGARTIAACRPPAPTEVENAAAVGQYKALLLECRQKGRDHKSYQVYSECADAVDAWLCQKSALRCTDGGADVR